MSDEILKIVLEKVEKQERAKEPKTLFLLHETPTKRPNNKTTHSACGGFT